MTRWSWIAALALGGTTLAFSAAAQANDEGHEKVVSMDQVPAPARATILKQAAGAPILKVEQETEQGKTVYEAHVKKGGEEIGINVAADGTFLGTHSEKSEKKEGNHESR